MSLATDANLDKYIPHLKVTMERYEINTPKRIGAFLAQLAHESGELRYVREIASGEAYEGRLDLGNINKGDGVKFKGRGLIQITGRANYRELSKEIGIDFMANTERLEDPLNACLSAGWFWKTKRLNQFCDTMNFTALTKRINGGLNGYADRLGYYQKARKVFDF